ncbi:MAG: hypothetical protein HRU06_20150 [Oceanospirillaceae bacterium]|nr:hypothetical protein [Oceanospirillaceae bacterium]
MNSFNSLGSSQPEVVLYIDNTPQWEEQLLDVPALIDRNGNHWRKILTIFSKLCCDDDWREYRDKNLLHDAQQINFSEALVPSAQIHIFSGKACWQRFGITNEMLADMRSIPCDRVFYHQSATRGLMLYTPYFDYRQFPNVLIAQVRAIMKAAPIV